MSASSWAAVILFGGIAIGVPLSAWLTDPRRGRLHSQLRSTSRTETGTDDMTALIDATRERHPSRPRPWGLPDECGCYWRRAGQTVPVWVPCGRHADGVLRAVRGVGQ